MSVEAGGSYSVTFSVTYSVTINEQNEQKNPLKKKTSYRELGKFTTHLLTPAGRNALKAQEWQ